MSKFVMIWLDFLNQLMDLSHLLKNTFYICCGLKNRLLFLYVINKYCLNGFQDYGNAILEICKTVRKLSKSLSSVLYNIGLRTEIKLFLSQIQSYNVTWSCHTMLQIQKYHLNIQTIFLSHIKGFCHQFNSFFTF